MLSRAGLSVASFSAPLTKLSLLCLLGLFLKTGFIEKGHSVPVSVFFHFKDMESFLGI